MANSNFLTKMAGLFSTRYDNGIPTPNVIQGHGKKRQFMKFSKNSPMSVMWNYFLTENYDTKENLKERKNRYLDLDFAIKNNPIIQMAADLYADEASQCENAGTPVRVNAKSDVQKTIQELLDQWGITQPTVRECIWNKVVFGDSFEANDISDKEGITAVTPLTVWDIVDRIEFTPSQLLEKLQGLLGNVSYDNYSKLKNLTNSLQTESDSLSSIFNKYLLAFELQGNQMVAPWAITHYRSFNTLQEFAPWGRSQFINVLPAFRQLMTSEGLMQVARAASFPRDVYKVHTEPGATTTEKWELLEEFQEQLDNAGLKSGTKDLPAIGGRIVMPKDLADYEQQTNSLDLDQIADIEYQRENLIIGTSIPKSYLIVDQGAWGTSGQSLLQQFKPFGRKVFGHQSDYLEGLSEKIKLHLAITGQHQGWDTSFELIMEFPVIEESSERTQHKSDEIRLAQDTISAIKDVLGVDDVPPDVVKDAFGIMTSLSQGKIDSYVDGMVKLAKENESSNDSSSFFENCTKARNKMEEEFIRDRLIEKSFEIKENLRMQEGVSPDGHYRYSKAESAQTKKTRTLLEAFMGDDKDGRVLFNESLTTSYKGHIT